MSALGQKRTCAVQKGMSECSASDRIAAAPLISVMNSRRLIASPEASDMNIVAVQMRAVKGCPMSVLGQKRTHALVYPARKGRDC